MSREQLQWLVLGHRTAAAIAAAVELGLVDLLAERPRTATDLAEAAGTDPDATSRLLRALVAVDLVEQDAERRFALTELGAPLRSDAPCIAPIPGTAPGGPGRLGGLGAPRTQRPHRRERLHR